MNKDRFILSIDNRDDYYDLAAKCFDHIWGIKVHALMDTQQIKRSDYACTGKIFADMKLFDTPDTLVMRITSLASIQPKLVSIHLRNPLPALREAQLAAEKLSIDLVGITYLTSEDATPEQIASLARKAAMLRIPYIVCGVPDLEIVKNAAPEIKTICPGIHYGEPLSGQKRTVHFEEAMTSAADKLVLGRMIKQIDNPWDFLRALPEIGPDTKFTQEPNLADEKDAYVTTIHPTYGEDDDGKLYRHKRILW